MEAQRRERPNLQPIWTDYYNLKGHPKSAFRVAHSPLFSASRRSPRTLPSPVYPSNSGYDPTIRRHERTMVESFDQRARQTLGLPDGLPRCLPPIAEQAWSPGPPTVSVISATHPPSPATPHSPHGLFQVPRRQTIADETRSRLLSRVPPLHVRGVSTPVDRRRSLPTTPTCNRRRNSHLMREHLQAWGHIYVSNATSADCFVAAVALRRPSEASSGDEEIKQEKDSAATKSSRRTIRARIRPRAPERKPFILQRTFDLDELRATIPEPSPTSSATSRRPSADLSPFAQAHPGRRRSSGGVASSGAGSLVVPEANKSLVLDAKALPIHLQYARVHVPVLAALMLSGHVREGDIIDLPMPHPEAWPQTIAYFYTGLGELTEAIKRNILYLAGKV